VHHGAGTLADQELRELGPFEGREPQPTPMALPAPPDRVATRRRSGVDDPVVVGAATGTAHADRLL
jgi:hypothetical protein